MAFILTLLKIVSLLAAIWSGVNGANLAAKINEYNTQVVSAAHAVRSGDGVPTVTADAPTTFDWAATVLPGLLSLATFASTLFFGKGSKAAVTVDQLRDLVERLGIGKAIDLTPDKRKHDASVTPVVPVGPVDAASDGVSTLAKLQALAVLSSPIQSMFAPFVNSLWAAVAANGLPKGFSLTLFYHDRQPYSIQSHPGISVVAVASKGDGDSDGAGGDGDVKLTPKPPNPSRSPVPSAN